MSVDIKMTNPGKLTKEDRERALGSLLIEKSSNINMPGQSKTIEDPFEEMYGEGGAANIVRPPINLLEMASLWENNTVLNPCIDAMEVNIDGLGHRFVPYKLEGEIPDKIKKEMEIEKTILDNFFKYASVEEPELSFTDLRKRKRRDQETTGGAWWEVLRGRTGELMGFNIIPSHTCRFSKLSEEPVETKQKLLLKNSDGSLYWKERIVYKRFRKMVQIRSHKVSWFKMFGDPRIIDYRDGEVKTELEPKYHANECIYFPCVWSARSPYGFPRYIGNLFSIYGSRSAETINYFTFENNNIPSMAIMVSNGMLTDGTIERIKEFVQSQISGRKNYSKFLIMESEPVSEGVANPGTMKLDIKPLTDVQHKDELFQNYDLNNRKKVKGSFRLPPIYVGETEDYNKATAQVTKILTEEQVFHPNRTPFDELMNRLILPELGVKYWTFKTNTPDTTDNETLVKLLAAAEKTGGINPAIARSIVADIFSKELEPVKGIDPEIPFSIQLAHAVKNTGNVNSTLSTTPSEETFKSTDKLFDIKNELQKIYKSEYEKLFNESSEVDFENDE